MHSGFISKTCVVCGESKPVIQFEKDHRVKGGFGARCKVCKCEDTRRRRYGLTVEQYEKIRDQDTCDICGLHAHQHLNGRLHIDHDHSTNEVRGMLCNSCNLILGHAQDNPEILLRAINYLRRDTAKQSQFELGGDALENSGYD